MLTFIIINRSFCQYKCFGDNDNSRMWKQYYYYSVMKMCYKDFVPDYFPYPAVRLALFLLLILSRDDYALSTDSTPQDSCAFKGSDFVCWGSICLYVRHSGRNLYAFSYCRFSGSFCLSKQILRFDKCAILSSAQTADLWLKWQNLAESQQKAENVHSS